MLGPTNHLQDILLLSNVISHSKAVPCVPQHTIEIPQSNFENHHQFLIVLLLRLLQIFLDVEDVILDHYSHIQCCFEFFKFLKWWLIFMSGNELCHQLVICVVVPEVHVGSHGLSVLGMLKHMSMLRRSWITLIVDSCPFTMVTGNHL